MAGKIIIINTGDKYGHLTVIKEVARKIRSKGRMERMFLCKCRCGKEKIMPIKSVRNRSNISCGCTRTEKCRQQLVTHNLTKHPLFTVWMNMRRRVSDDPTSENYKYYYGAGVRICREWDTNFRAFYDWAIANGWRKGLQIDKDKLYPTKPGLMYSPEFCCVSTRTENMNHTTKNVKFTFNGELLTLCEISRRTGINRNTLWRRINVQKLNPEDAFKIKK